MTSMPPALQPAAAPAPDASSAPAEAPPGAVREAVHDISGTLCALQGYSFLLRRELTPGSDGADLLDCIDEAIARLRSSSERLAATVPAAPQR